MLVMLVGESDNPSPTVTHLEASELIPQLKFRGVSQKESGSRFGELPPIPHEVDSWLTLERTYLESKLP